MISEEHDCAVCEDEALKGDPRGMFKRRFIVCPECGNKRCPQASAHWLRCSGSNEPGQIGSFYGPEEHWPSPLHGESQPNDADSTKGER